MTAQLKLVPPTPERVDIYAKWRAEIAARNWQRVHIIADRRLPIDLGEAQMRRRGSKAIIVRAHSANRHD